MFKRIKQAYNLFKLKKLYKKRNAQGHFIRFQTGNTGLLSVNDNPPGVEELTDTREVTKPKDVLHLLETHCEVKLKDLDTLIVQLTNDALVYSKTLKHDPPEDLTHAIAILRARKRYHKVEDKIEWKTTTEEKIEALCKKYKLAHRPVIEFLPHFPEIVLKEVKKFKAIYSIASNKVFSDLQEPELSVIAPPELFDTRKGDPILLAKSPFGEFYYILCAWDKEVDYLDLLA